MHDTDTFARVPTLDSIAEQPSVADTDKAIYLSYAGLASLWCIAFAAVNIADIISGKQREHGADGPSGVNIGEEYAIRNVPEHIAYAKALFRADKDWPSEFGIPDAEADICRLGGRVNNVFFGALSWILLHEIAHVHHKDTVLAPPSIRVRQEYEADDFATRWILEDAGDGPDREFRVLMIVIALAWLFLREQTVQGGYHHPPTILRFREAASLFRMSGMSVGLENAAYILKAFLDPATSAPESATAHEAFDWISSRLEVLFART